VKIAYLSKSEYTKPKLQGENANDHSWNVHRKKNWNSI